MPATNPGDINVDNLDIGGGDSGGGADADVEVSGGPNPGDVRVETGGGSEVGGGDDVDQTTDPERGDETRREPKPDADADPMREQTVEVSGGPNPGDVRVNVDDGGASGGSDEVDIGSGGDVSSIDRGGPGGGGFGGGTQPNRAQDPGDVDTQRIEDEARNERLARELRDTSRGGGRAGGVSSRETEQIERDIVSGRVEEASTGGGGRASQVSSEDVTVTQVGGGPRPGDVTAEPGGITIPEKGDGPRPTRGQGIETETAGEGAPIFTINDPRPNRGTFTGTKPEIARLIEGLTLEDNRTLDRQDIAVVKTDGGLAVRQTFSGVQERWQVGSRARAINEQFRSDAATTARLGGLGAINQAVEEQVAIQRGNFVSGGPNPGDVTADPSALSDEIQGLDLSMVPWGATGELEVSGGPNPGDVRVGFGEPEGDYRLTPEFGAPGQFGVSLTESRIRTEAALAYEQQLAEQGRQVELNPEEDITITDSGPELTRSGRAKARGDEFSQQSTDVRIPIGLRTGTSRRPRQGLTVEATGIERMSLLDVKSGLENAQQTITEVNRAGAEDLRAITNPGGFMYSTYKAGGPPDVDIDEDSQAQELAEGVAEGLGTTWALPVSVAISSIDVAEFGLETKDIYREEGFGSQIGTIREDRIRGPQVEFGGSGAVGFTAEETAETASASVNDIEEQISTPRGAAQAVGTLVGTGLVMGGAAAIGPRAGLASRLAIQPGEEALGYGGYYATRAAAGARWAERLFPNKEPLLFSEEAALGAGRAIGGRALGGARRLGRLSRGEEVPFMTRARVEFGRPESNVGQLGPEPTGITGARSEPLGSPTEPILEATTGGLGRVEGVGESTPVQVETAEPSGGPSRLPLYGEIQESGDVRAFLRGEERSGDRPISTGQVENFESMAEDPRFGGGGPFQVGFGRTAGELRAEVKQESPEPFTDYSQFDEPVTPDFISQRQSLFGDYESETYGSEVEGPIERERLSSRPQLETETESDTRLRSETALGVEPFGIERPGARTDTLVESVVGTDMLSGTDVETAAVVELATESELEMEAELETESEFGLELETFRETETEFEFEGETDLEFEPFDGGGDTGDERRRRRGLPPWVERVEFEGIDPLTGR